MTKALLILPGHLSDHAAVVTLALKIHHDDVQESLVSLTHNSVNRLSQIVSSAQPGFKCSSEGTRTSELAGNAVYKYSLFG